MDESDDDQCRWNFTCGVYRPSRCMISCMCCKAFPAVGRWGTPAARDRVISPQLLCRALVIVFAAQRNAIALAHWLPASPCSNRRAGPLASSCRTTGHRRVTSVAAMPAGICTYLLQ